MKDTRHADDVLSLDFLPLGAYRTWSLPIWSKMWQTDMNKYLAHITYRRTEDRPAKSLPNWDHTVHVEPLRVEFNHAWWDFRAAVTDSDYSAEFDKQLSECEGRPEFKMVNLRWL